MKIPAHLMGWRTVYLAIIIIAGAAAFANSLACSFTFDDHTLIENNPAVLNADGWYLSFTSPYWPPPIENNNLYRPLVTCSYWIQNRMHGMLPMPFHFVNVLLHLAGAWILFILAGRILKNDFAAFCVALIHTLHPLATESVTSVVGRAELMAFVFGIAATLVFYRAAVKRSSFSFAASGVLILLALLCKESSVGFIPVAYICLLGPADGFKQRISSIRSIVPHAALLTALIVYLVIRFKVFGHPLSISSDQPLFLDNPLFYVSADVRIGTALTVLMKYMALFVWPATLSADYSYNQIPLAPGLFDPAVICSFAVLSMLGLLALWRARKEPPLFIGVFMFFCMIFTTSNLLFPIGSIMAERFVYSAFAGLCLVIAIPLKRMHEMSRRVRISAVVLLVVICLALGVRTTFRNLDWRSDATLSRSLVRTAPHSAKAYNMMGQMLLKEGDRQGAADSFAQALVIYPNDYWAWVSLGEMALSDRDFEKAHEYLSTALKLNPTGYTVNLDMGILFFLVGDPRAEGYLNAAIRKDPGKCEPYSILAVLQAKRGNEEVALSLMTKAVTMCPDNNMILENQRRMLDALQED